MMPMQSSLQSSENGDLEGAFGLLHPDIQRWIYEQQWTELREIQAKSIGAVLNTDRERHSYRF